MSLISAVLFGYAIVSIVMALLYPFAMRANKAGYVDVAWSYSMGLLAVVYLLLAPLGDSVRVLVVVAFVCFWSIRLGTHLLNRVSSEEEDGRYAEMKKSWGSSQGWKMFIFYQFQAVAASLLSLAYLGAMLSDKPFGGAWDYAAIAIVLISVTGEGIADRQLRAFKHGSSDPLAVCKVGLWRYSRHPNYFFEWVYWLSFPCLAFGTSYLWLTLLGPSLILYLLLKVTGIPPTEKQAIRKRGEAYRAYQRETSAFFPWFVKSNKI